MRKDKGSAFELRKAGKSYREIEKQLGVSRSTLSEWFREIEWSKHVEKQNTDRNISRSKERIQTLNKRREDRLKDVYNQAEEKAAEEYQIFKNEPLFMSGLMIYAIKGEKASTHIIRLRELEPYLERIFSNFVHEYLSAEAELQFGAGMSILSNTVLKKKLMKWLQFCMTDDAAMV